MDNTATVNEYMKNLEHPLKSEMEAVRTIILQANSLISERIKWNSPSFYYKGDMAVVVPRANGKIHIVFPNGIIINDPTGLLEGDYKDRRMAYFYDMADIKAKQAALEQIVNDWVNLMDRQ